MIAIAIVFAAQMFKFTQGNDYSSLIYRENGERKEKDQHSDREVIELLHGIIAMTRIDKNCHDLAHGGSLIL